MTQGSDPPAQPVAAPPEAVPRAGNILPLEPDDPKSVGPYAVEGRLGAGGMGTVFHGRGRDGKPVAVKVVRADLAGDDAFRARFRAEVAAARRVAGSCTARVLDADPDCPRPYLVTEYVDGIPLDRAIEADGPLPPSSLEGFAVGVAVALTAIHAAGIVHRDLKPGNVLLSPFGPKVIDFGIARALDGGGGRLTMTGMVMGSPGWMAPEQLTGQAVTPAADVFLWGVLVAFAGTGRHPFGTGAMDVVAYRVVHDRPDLAGLDGQLGTLVAQALSQEPARRPSARSLLLELLGDQAAGIPDAVPPSPPPSAPPSPPSGPQPVRDPRSGWPPAAAQPTRPAARPGVRGAPPGPVPPPNWAPTPPPPAWAPGQAPGPGGWSYPPAPGWGPPAQAPGPPPPSWGVPAPASPPAGWPPQQPGPSPPPPPPPPGPGPGQGPYGNRAPRQPPPPPQQPQPRYGPPRGGPLPGQGQVPPAVQTPPGAQAPPGQFGNWGLGPPDEPVTPRMEEERPWYLHKGLLAIAIVVLVIWLFSLGGRDEQGGRGRSAPPQDQTERPARPSALGPDLVPLGD